ncbi:MULTISPECIES: cryptochrome/photolyase family protein [unclassified Acinetobacter]|uniref:cryptochrome/photolyase family protein n=1 Tax=unclassified Acinetobacter TaxID=196816 RepID=UPI002934D753|nr:MULTISPECIES: cryptochrome/photolyase family protein [unclassified Acinetobacter]WOE32438.1 cryptochrome/photolyase family protein [Acinetobacter sp. SAAs470]WOE37912.1 cryptochrome/photolyase family protein [Acinetobacter sp. SAAs474]
MRFGLILGDQLSHSLATLQALDRDHDIILMAEVLEEATYVAHHPQKIALIFSAMRHFAKALKAQGWRIHYHCFASNHLIKKLLDFVQLQQQRYHATQLVFTHCGEYRLQQEIVQYWPQQLQLSIQCLDDTRFFCTPRQFQSWAQSYSQRRMEYFYRHLRKKTGYLMQDGQPIGQQWNYDHVNRKAWSGTPPLIARLKFKRDQIDLDVIALVKHHFPHHIGQLEQFDWATTRDHALDALHYFIEHHLAYFGDYQDAMAIDADILFHSALSPYLNCGLLLAKEVCDAAETAYYQGRAPLNAVEGFIRQILGWREYVRGIYWLYMPQYATQNFLNAQAKLPQFYWTGQTKMTCMAECFRNTFQHAYAHHIQRLMVTGNFALLTGVNPQALSQWYLAVYADAYQWVELPNTIGMVMYADGGIMASKPYIASGNYIDKMSNYCASCHYNVKTRTATDSCPFNSLYWYFLIQHQAIFRTHPRMKMIYRQLDQRQDLDEISTHAQYLLQHIDEL